MREISCHWHRRTQRSLVPDESHFGAVAARLFAANPAAAISRKPSRWLNRAAKKGRQNHLHAARLSSARNISARARTTTISQAGRADPGAQHGGGLPENWRRSTGGACDYRLAVREACERPLSQHGGHHRRRWQAAWHLPEDAHPGRSALLRKILLHPRRHRFQSAWQTKHGKIGVLICWDQWYPEAARLHGATGRGDSILSTIGHRLASQREEGITAPASTVRWQISHQGARRGQRLGYVAAVNCIGTETPVGGGRHRKFWGPELCRGHQRADLRQSQRVETRRRSSSCRSTSDKVDVTRTHWPFLRDRRIDAYGDMTKRRFID